MNERGPLAVLAEYTSESKPGVVYQIRIGGDEKLYCTCLCWVFKSRKGGGDCKHLTDWRLKNGKGT